VDTLFFYTQSKQGLNEFPISVVIAVPLNPTNILVPSTKATTTGMYKIFSPMLTPFTESFLKRKKSELVNGQSK
jgi:hypothetical protein